MTIVNLILLLPLVFSTLKTEKANSNKKAMSISINLYRLEKAEKLDDIKDLESQIAKTSATKVNLYKVSGDIAIILLNNTDPFSSPNTIPYKMVYGNRAQKSVGIGEVGGFIPSSEIPEIIKWIKENKIETFDGFSKMYDNLSKEVKSILEEMGTDNKASLYNGYVKPLITLFFAALENQNSVVFVGQ